MPLSVKLGLGIYQVIWYWQKSFVRGVNHVLRLEEPLLVVEGDKMGSLLDETTKTEPCVTAGVTR